MFEIAKNLTLFFANFSVWGTMWSQMEIGYYWEIGYYFSKIDVVISDLNYSQILCIVTYNQIPLVTAVKELLINQNSCYESLV